MTMNVKVLLVEDHDIVRQGIRMLLETEPWITICGEVPNGSEALKMIPSMKPDIVLMDMNMPVMNGIDCTKKIKQQFSGKKVLVLSMHDNENYLMDMLDAGADGYVLKNANKEELLFAIRKIANDGVYIGAEFTMNMLAKYRSTMTYTPAAAKSVKISDREMDVLQRIAIGRTNAEIAQELFTSVRTIETRRKNLLDKTGTTNTATLIRFAVLNGLVK